MSKEKIHQFKDKSGKEHEFSEKHIKAMVQMYKKSKCALINTRAKAKVEIEIVDEDDVVQSMNELTNSIVEFINEELEDDSSSLATEFYPMLMSSIVHYAIESYPEEIALFVLTNDLAKSIASKAMLHGFLMGQVMRENDLEIRSKITKLSDEELKAIEKTQKVQDIATSTLISGVVPNQLKGAINESIIDGLKEMDFDGEDFDSDDFEDPDIDDED